MRATEHLRRPFGWMKTQVHMRIQIQHAWRHPCPKHQEQQKDEREDVQV